MEKHDDEDSSTIQTVINNPIIDKFVNFANANDMKFIIYIAPYMNKTIKLTKDFDFIINHSAFLDDPNLFYDVKHVDFEGRILATQGLANELFENQ